MQRWLVDNLPRAQQNSYIDDLYGIVTDQPNSVPFQFSFHSVLCSIPGFSNNPYSEINPRVMGFDALKHYFITYEVYM